MLLPQSVAIFIGGLLLFWHMDVSSFFKFDIDEVHHAYYGWMILWMAPLHYRIMEHWIYWTLMAIGLILLIDDLWQHHRQVKNANYRSFIHRLMRIFRLTW